MPASPRLRPRILLIEDNPDRNALFREWLQGTPYLLIEATTGGQAMGLLRHGAEGIAGICLDHDLNSRPMTAADEWVSGSNVATRICEKVPKAVPVLVHSMNTIKAPEMVKRLSGAGFSVTRRRMCILNRAMFHSWLTEVDDAWEHLCSDLPPSPLISQRSSTPL